MPSERPPCSIAVVGPPILMVTALVGALRERGFTAERVSPPSSFPDGACFPRPGPGVLILDVDMVGSRCVSHAVASGWTVLAIGSETNRERVAAAVAAGADAWIRKSTSFDQLVRSAQAAVSGRLRMSEEERESWQAVHRSTNDTVLAQVEKLEQLSTREREVFGHLLDGLRAADICGILFVSLATVRSHIQSILSKLGVNSQQQAVDVYRKTARLARTIGSNPHDR